jgi:hypothetical protein
LNDDVTAKFKKLANSSFDVAQDEP